MHVLPTGFQKIRYYGFLNNRWKKRNLKLIFELQNGQRFKRRYENMSIGELLKVIWDKDINSCPCCGGINMVNVGRVYALK